MTTTALETETTPMNATPIQWTDGERFKLFMDIKEKFDIWATNITLEDKTRKVLSSLGGVIEFDGLLNKSWTLPELFKYAKWCASHQDTFPTFEQFAKDLHSTFDTTTTPIVACYLIKRRRLKNGTLKYKFSAHKKTLKVRNKFIDEPGKHMRLAMERINNGQPLGEFVFA